MLKVFNKRYTKFEIKERIIAIAFFAPFAILFIGFTIWPVLSAIYYSLTNFSIVQNPIYVGLKNYQYLFTEDNVFLVALTNTFSFAVISGMIGYCLSFIVAWIINNVRFKTLFALAFYAPSITSGIAMSIVWLYFFSPDAYGLINNTLIQLGIISKPILWTQNPSLILPVVAIVATWMGMGNGFLGFLAGFQNLSKEIFEAGSIDGVQNNCL
jgi:multiple sugar transport system permease protein